MSSTEAQRRKLRQIQEVAEGWGKLLAREAFPGGPGLDVSLIEMEELAATASKAMVRGAIETLTGDQAKQMPEEVRRARSAGDCAACIHGVPDRSRCVAARPRSTNRWGTARRVVGIFFPLRPVLKIDGHEYSPTLYLRILHMASVVDGFDTAAIALEVVGELSVSSRQINKLATEAGAAMAERARCADARSTFEAPLPRVATTAEMPLDLAAVFGDGGRMRTRDAGSGFGSPSTALARDEERRLPSHAKSVVRRRPAAGVAGLLSQRGSYVEKLVKGLKNVREQGREEDAESTPAEAEEPGKRAVPEALSWQPETLFRTCVSSLGRERRFRRDDGARSGCSRLLYGEEKGVCRRRAGL